MNYIWAGIMAVSLLFGMLNGRMDEITRAVLIGADDGVGLIIALMGGMCLWSGLMSIAEKSGITVYISHAFSPFLRLIFKNLDKNSKAARAICMNMTANLLGLGNAATPLGIEAMKELQKGNPDKNTASDNMVTFVVLNTASLQLIPATVAVLRSKNGAARPFDILPAVWTTTVIVLAVGLITCKLLERFSQRREQQKSCAEGLKT